MGMYPENESMDIVFMSQAFHHADQPLKLLTEIDRVTRGGGGGSDFVW